MADARTAFMVDSGCGPTQALIQKHDLNVVGMNVMLDGKAYIDGEELLQEQFYAHVDGIRALATSPPTQSEMIQRYKALKERGYQRVIDFHMSAKVSRVFDNSQAAKGFVPGLDIHVIDTNSVSAGGYFVAEKVIELIHKGCPMEDVQTLLPEIQRSAQLLFSVSSLNYFIKNGRIGRAKGMVGNLLRKKPVLMIKDGEVSPFSIEKGIDRAIERIADASLEFLAQHPHNVKIFTAYGADSNQPFAQQAFTRLVDRLPRIPIADYEVVRGRGWPTIICHTGPEVFILAVYGERRPI